jgi:hypothetical protein
LHKFFFIENRAKDGQSPDLDLDLAEPEPEPEPKLIQSRLRNK